MQRPIQFGAKCSCMGTLSIDKVDTRAIEWDQGVSPFLFAISG